MKGLLLLIFLSIQIIDFAQTESDIKLAQYYYSNGEFDKAVGYFEKIYSSTPSKIVYTQYKDCLMAIKDYKSVEKIIKKQISLNKNDPDYTIQLGFFYEELKEDEKARKIFSSVIKDLSYNPNQVKDILGTPLIASVFHSDRWDYAFTIVRKGTKPQQRQLSVYFKDDVYERFEGDDLPSESEFAERIAVPEGRKVVPRLEATSKELERFQKNSPAPVNTTPKPAGPPSDKTYPPLETP